MPFHVTVLLRGIGEPVDVTTIETRGSRRTALMRARWPDAVSQKLSRAPDVGHDHPDRPALLVRPDEGALVVGEEQLLLDVVVEAVDRDVLVVLAGRRSCSLVALLSERRGAGTARCWR